MLVISKSQHEQLDRSADTLVSHLATATPIEVRPRVDLSELRCKIDAANERFADGFRSWILEVGSLVRAARDSPDLHGEDGFIKWAMSVLRRSKSQVYRLLDAERVVQKLTASPIGDVPLPSNESQCRELSQVPVTILPEVWLEVCEQAVTQEKPVNAALIRDTVRRRCDAKPAVTKSDVFDEAAAVDRLAELLDREISRWPESLQGNAAEAIEKYLKLRGLGAA